MRFRAALFSLSIATLVVCASRPASAADIPATAPLESGYHQMYNLDFDGAHRTFEAWEKAHPQDPLGPVSNAAAYLFSEFNRLHVLESELFVDDERFARRTRLSPDPVAQATFDAELRKTDEVANAVLRNAPGDRDALFAKILAGGLRSDYIALVEKRNFAALSTIKATRSSAERLLSEDPSYYDAYLAVGVENYLLGVNPAPVRWLLRLGGAQTDKEEGIAKLRLTAEKGHYLAPYARLLLAVAALRDHDRNQARLLLSGLAREFPQNPLYRKELDRIAP